MPIMIAKPVAITIRRLITTDNRLVTTFWRETPFQSRVFR